MDRTLVALVAAVIGVARRDIAIEAIYLEAYKRGHDDCLAGLGRAGVPAA